MRVVSNRFFILIWGIKELPIKIEIHELIFEPNKLINLHFV